MNIPVIEHKGIYSLHLYRLILVEDTVNKFADAEALLFLNKIWKI